MVELGVEKGVAMESWEDCREIEMLNLETKWSLSADKRIDKIPRIKLPDPLPKSKPDPLFYFVEAVI
jgi:hypothetical protein